MWSNILHVIYIIPQTYYIAQIANVYNSRSLVAPERLARYNKQAPEDNQCHTGDRQDLG